MTCRTYVFKLFAINMKSKGVRVKNEKMRENVVFQIKSYFIFLKEINFKMLLVAV